MKPSAYNPSNRITTKQVIKAMGLHPTHNQSTAIGLRAQAEYAKEFHEQPPKDNRPKTYGKGVHCFALYPETWRGKIEVHINAVMDTGRNQGDLFQ